MDTCTLVLEYNYTKKPDGFGTIWIFNGDGTASLAKREPIQELAGWSKIVGGLPYETASLIHSALKAFFEKSGVRVIDQGVAD